MNLPILMYHDISSALANDLTVSVPQFMAQMEFLRQRGFQSLSLASVAQLVQGRGAWPRRGVVITFDDAYRSVTLLAAPVLKAMGFTATVFTVSAAVGRDNFWDAAGGQPRRLCLDWPDLKSLAQDGWEIGSHGAAHANLTGAADTDLQMETAGSMEILSSRLGQPIRVFAYPYGAWDARARGAVQRAGYAAACAISPGTASVTSDLLALRRIYVKGQDTLADFARKISGWYLAYRGLMKR